MSNAMPPVHHKMGRRAMLLGCVMTTAIPAWAQDKKFVYLRYPKPGEPKPDNVDNSRRIVPAPAKDY